MKKYSRGFTLIELLVVIAIIGILASVILVSLNSARGKAQDAKIKSDLVQIQTALEMYYNQYGTYAVSGSGYLNYGDGWLQYQDGGSYTTAVTTVLAQQGFIGTEPLQSPPNYMIYQCNGGQSYSLTATIANATTADVAHLQTLCNGPGVNSGYGKNYGIGN